MLTAERAALETRVVQRLAAVKEKEFDYMLGRFQAIALQAALTTEVLLSNLNSLTPPEAGEPGDYISWVFYVSGMLGVCACVYVLAACLYMGNTAPRIALRGPEGGLIHAYNVVISERRQINVVFITALLSMVVNTTSCVWILSLSVDDPGAVPEFKVTGYSLVCTFMGTVAIIGNGYCLQRMQRRFFGESGGASGATATIAAVEGGEESVRAAAKTQGAAPWKAPTTSAQRRHPLGKLFGNSKGAEGVGALAGAADGVTSVGMVLSTESRDELERSGVLWKRVGAHQGGSAGSLVDSLLWRVKAAAVQAGTAVPWQPRFCVLSEGRLSYWREEGDRLERPPSAEIPMAGFEVFIDAEDADFGLELRPAFGSSHTRSWYFRAASEDDRLQWAQRMVAHSLL